MQIRNMTIEDYPSVYKLWLSCKGMGLNDIDDSEAGIEKFLKRNPQTCFVAVDEETISSEFGENIVGGIMAGNDGRRGYIYHTVVSPEHRGKGIAHELVNRVEEAFKALGIAKVALVVFDKNDIGNAFWEKEGYKAREDLVYRNKSLIEITRIDT